MNRFFLGTMLISICSFQGGLTGGREVTRLWPLHEAESGFINLQASRKAHGGPDGHQSLGAITSCIKATSPTQLKVRSSALEFRNVNTGTEVFDRERCFATITILFFAFLLFTFSSSLGASMTKTMSLIRVTLVPSTWWWEIWYFTSDQCCQTITSH